MNEEEAKELIETGTIKKIQAAIDNHELQVNDKVSMKGKFGRAVKLPYICYAMLVGRPDVLELLLKNHAKVNVIMPAPFFNDKTIPLNFAVGDYNLYEDEQFSSPMLKNMKKYVKEYITLLSNYGARFDVIDKNGNTIFMTATFSSNPVVLETTVKEAKKRLPARKFLELLKHMTPDGKGVYNYKIPGPLYNYWQTEGLKLRKELEDTVEAEIKEALKAARKRMQEKAKKAMEKAALYAKKQKQND